MTAPARLVDAERVAAAAAVLRERLAPAAPVAAIVLGSGLGALAERLEHRRVVPFAEVPGFPPAGVVGHAGAVMAGALEGREVLCLAGRFHRYEGYGTALATLPVRVLHALGAPVLLLSNAAGGVRRTLRPGDLMLIADHLDLQGGAPLPYVATGRAGCDVYDPALRALVRRVAAERRIALQEGVYAAVLGPSYETAAEVRMLERLGADAVGMSTVPEAKMARLLGMRVAAVSCITNHACGIATTPLDHAEVLAVGQRVAAEFEALIAGVVAGV